MLFHIRGFFPPSPFFFHCDTLTVFHLFFTEFNYCFTFLASFNANCFIYEIWLVDFFFWKKKTEIKTEQKPLFVTLFRSDMLKQGDCWHCVMCFLLLLEWSSFATVSKIWFNFKLWKFIEHLVLRTNRKHPVLTYYISTISSESVQYSLVSQKSESKMFIVVVGFSLVYAVWMFFCIHTKNTARKCKIITQQLNCFLHKDT